MKTLVSIIVWFLFGLAAVAEPAPPAPEELNSFQLISGFHSHFDRSSGFEFRILEVDGSATVAQDPITLYLVATNNSSGEDLQSSVVALPKVSAIKRIRTLDRENGIRIEALFDRIDVDGSVHGKVDGIIEITIPIKEGKLPESIDVAVTKADGRAADEE